MSALIIVSDPVSLATVGLTDPEAFKVDSIEGARLWEALAVLAARILRHPNTEAIAPNLCRANLTLTPAQEAMIADRPSPAFILLDEPSPAFILLDEPPI